MKHHYVIDHDEIVHFLYNYRDWCCDGDPIVHVVRRSRDEHGCLGWKITAFCEEHSLNHVYFVTRHEALNAHLAYQYPAFLRGYSFVDTKEVPDVTVTTR